MKKINKTISILLIICILLSFTSCACKHEWLDATCTTPKTCSLCGTTEGESLGHDFQDATCTKPKTCSVCGETEGDALGHDFRTATCTTPKICNVCEATEGKPLGHNYVDGYCTRCGEKNPDYIDLNNLGFYNMYGMNKWIEIYAYNFSMNRVCVEATPDGKKFEFCMFFDNYLFNGCISIEQLSAGNRVDESMLSGVSTFPSEILSNDTLIVDDYEKESFTIKSRIVNTNNTAMILKLSNGGREQWFAPADLLDFTTITKIENEERHYDCYSISFRESF